VAIISVEQGFKSIESRQDYRTGTGMIYGERGISMDIWKAKDNFNKDGKPKYFNCNVYRHIAKDYRKSKREQDTRKYYKYNKIGHIAENCKTG